MMASGNSDGLLAELAALNTAVIRALSAVTVIVEKEGVPRQVYLDNLLKAGEDAIGKANYVGFHEERRDEIIQKARARYADIVRAVQHSTPPKPT
jgi:hypothetical protein